MVMDVAHMFSLACWGFYQSVLAIRCDCEPVYFRRERVWCALRATNGKRMVLQLPTARDICCVLEPSMDSFTAVFLTTTAINIALQLEFRRRLNAHRDIVTELVQELLQKLSNGSAPCLQDECQAETTPPLSPLPALFRQESLQSNLWWQRSAGWIMTWFRFLAQTFNVMKVNQMYRCWCMHVDLCCFL